MKWFLFFIIAIFTVACSSQRGSEKRSKKFDSTFNNPFYKNTPHPKIFFQDEDLNNIDKDETKVSIKKDIERNHNTKDNKKREEIVKYALSFEGKKRFSKKFRNDCSGYVKMVYDKFNINLYNLERSQLKENGRWINGSKLIYKYSKTNGQVYKRDPQIGDFIFFDNTTDRNRDGKLNDYFTHIAIVVKIDKDGTIHYIHNSNRGINIQKMNLNYPATSYLRDGKKKSKINSYLRKKRRKDNKNTKYLSAQMFRSFGTVFR